MLAPLVVFPMAFPVDDPEAFKTLLAECSVPAAQRDHLTQSGYTTVSQSGCPDADNSEGFLEFVSLEGQRSNSFSAQTATLRMAYGKCFSKTGVAVWDSDTCYSQKSQESSPGRLTGGLQVK